MLENHGRHFTSVYLFSLPCREVEEQNCSFTKSQRSTETIGRLHSTGIRSDESITLLGADHLIRGGGGLWFFLHDQTFFDSQLKRKKANIFFLSGKTQNKFFHHLFYLILRTSSRGVTTLTWTIYHFLIRKAIVWNM